MAKRQKFLQGSNYLHWVHNDDKTLVYQKGGAIFAFNFHSSHSYEGLFIPVPKAGKYEVIFSSDDFCYGGEGRIYHQSYRAEKLDGKWGIRLYLPSRTAVVLKNTK